VQKIIGIVPDESNLYDDMSGFDNLVFCASLYGIKKEERKKRALKLLQQFSLDDTGKRPFKAYSKGMKRKLTIAAGIIHKPDILFLDEPTTGIDVESARQIRKLIQDLNANGTTIFLTTHYIEEAERLCNRIGFIVGGKIIKVSTINELMDEAQQENILEFRTASSVAGMEHDMMSSFQDITVHILDNETIRITSKEKMELKPFMAFFDMKNIGITEARIIRPSLEEVFVKITGIEIAKLTKEKEAGGKKK